MKLKRFILFLISLLLISGSGMAQGLDDLDDLDSLDEDAPKVQKTVKKEKVTTSSDNLDELDSLSDDSEVSANSAKSDDNLDEIDSSDSDSADSDDEDSDEDSDEESGSKLTINFNGYIKAMDYRDRAIYSRDAWNRYKSINSAGGSAPTKRNDDSYSNTGVRTQLKMEGYLGDKAKFFSAINLDFNESDNSDSDDSEETKNNNSDSRTEDVRIVETYIELYESNRTWKLGTQIITWGFMEGFEVPTDRINARDNQYASTEYEDTKLASTGLLLTQPIGADSMLDLIYIPRGKNNHDLAYREELFDDGEKLPEAKPENNKYALRFNSSVGKLEYALSYVEGTDPVSDVIFEMSGSHLKAKHTYNRMKSPGVDLQYNFSDWIAKAAYVEKRTQKDDENKSSTAGKLKAGKSVERIKHDSREYLIGGEFKIDSTTINAYAGQRFIDGWQKDDSMNSFVGQADDKLNYLSGYITADFLTGDALNLTLYISDFWNDSGKRVITKNKATLKYKLDDGLEILCSPSYVEIYDTEITSIQAEVKYSF